MKKAAVLSILFLMLFPVLGHEFWLQPQKFIYHKNGMMTIRFLVGENFEGENWKGNKERINTLTYYHGKSVIDIANKLSATIGDSLQLQLETEGTKVFTYNSKNSFIQLDAEKFTNYLKEDGLENALAYRKAHNEDYSDGKENYQRSVKTIVQVGSYKDNTFYRTTNLPLDIIPQKNPYTIKDKDTMKVKIFFRKKLLSNTLVNVWHRVNNKTTRQELYSNENGEIKFVQATKGMWMISTVKMERLRNDKKADWQSYWGSCTWGYQ
ncbi:MAG: DUF4198 domain-containing protein [Daejeonella sp.]